MVRRGCRAIVAVTLDGVRLIDNLALTPGVRMMSAAPPSATPGLVAGSRPKTLPASVAPVITGTAVAIHEGGEHWPSAILALVTALLLQIAANFANDAFDFRRGADTAERLGPTRITSSGLIAGPGRDHGDGARAPGGGYDGVAVGDPGRLADLRVGDRRDDLRGGLHWRAVATGLSRAWGSVRVRILRVGGGAGTAYIQTGELTALALVAAIPVGALGVGILIVNNLRDIDTDRVAGKHTIAVRLGEQDTQYEYGVMLVIAAVTPVVMWTVGWLDLGGDHPDVVAVWRVALEPGHDQDRAGAESDAGQYRAGAADLQRGAGDGIDPECLRW